MHLYAHHQSMTISHSNPTHSKICVCSSYICKLELVEIFLECTIFYEINGTWVEALLFIALPFLHFKAVIIF